MHHSSMVVGDPNASIYQSRTFSQQQNSTMLDGHGYNSILNGSQQQSYDYHNHHLQQQHQQQLSSIGGGSYMISNRNHYVPSEYSDTTRCCSLILYLKKITSYFS